MTSGKLLFKSHPVQNHIVPEKSLMTKDDLVRAPQQIEREKKTLVLIWAQMENMAETREGHYY